jgi:hypothetical protein
MLVLLNAGSEAVVIVSLALTALVVNVTQVQFAEKRAFLRTVPPLGVLLSLPLANPIASFAADRYGSTLCAAICARCASSAELPR